MSIIICARIDCDLAIAQIIDFYLDESRKDDLKMIVELCGRNDSESEALLVGYYREGARLNPQYV